MMDNQFQSAEELYQDDPVFRKLVDVLFSHLIQGDFSSSSLRKAAAWTADKYENLAVGNPYSIPLGKLKPY